ncbi:shikimate kinase [Lutibacter agarilyticus]|uniref:Shikimate kinase n=1 Tax=Lutibacter agarilyticus TaxID=1109740 RepID=A0A238XH37_9FLAO|nr:shikimate kinase [Lutibacter agarilyticus]SNR58012.1 shikimate kinase [Lutibacter agarilyticus]
MKYNIVLIGAMGIGKTTISNLICEQNNAYSVLDSDAIKGGLVEKLGFDEKEYQEILDQKGWLESNNYARNFLKPEHLNVILDVASSNKIINLGGDFIDWNNEEDFEKCHKYLRDYPNVIMLRYSNDLKENYDELSKRIKKRINKDTSESLQQQVEYNLTYIQSDLFSKVAKHVIETKGKTEDEVAMEIIKIYSDSIPKIDD